MKKMHLSIELSEDGSLSLETEGLKYTITAESPETAISQAAQIVGAVFPVLATDPCGLNLGAPAFEPDYGGGGTAAEGDNEQDKLVVIDAAIEQERAVLFSYTDTNGNNSTREADPVERGWAGGDSPRRAMYARHNGMRKTFFVDKISRIELV